MALTVSFEAALVGIDSRVTHLNLYRKHAAETLYTRIAQITVRNEYADPDGTIGDTYYFTFFDSVRFLESGPSPIIVATQLIDGVHITGYTIGSDGQRAVTSHTPGVTVRVLLQVPSLDSPVFDGQTVIPVNQEIITDQTGKFEFDVVPNDKIFPSSTFYKIEYLGRRFYKEVRSTDGAGQLFSGLRDVPPLELR